MDCYLLRMLNMNLVVTTNPKLMIGTQKIKRKTNKQNTKGTHWSQRKKARGEEKNKEKLQNKKTNF